MPFLFLMTALASRFTMNTLKQSDNLKLIVIGLITCLATFYFKPFIFGFRKTQRISK